MNKSYILGLLIGIIATSLIVFFTFLDVKKIKHSYIQNIYKKNLSEINTLLLEERNFLNSFTTYLSNVKEIKQAYLENNKTKIINYVLPLFNSLYPEFITEIHFFKTPAINFVDFSNLKEGEKNISIRKDILQISTSLSPSNHFFVCKLYPGLRSTKPIFYKNKLLGSVSIGVSIENLMEILKHFNSTKVSFYLNNNILKHFLMPDRYERYKKLPMYKHYRVIGDIFEVDLNKNYQIKQNSFYTIYEVKDFFGNDFGYFIIKDDISAINKTVKTHIKHIIFVGIFATILGLILIYFIYSFFRKKYSENSKIIELIKNKEFEKIPKNSDSDQYKKDLIDLANELKLVYDLMNKKINYYENKAYKDSLTNAYNRNFLEENAKKLLIEFKIAYNNVGVIVLDADNFKKINDTYGHDVGDLVLIEISQKIRNLLRKQDILIRYGGEEFVIFLPNCDLKETYNIAEKIRKNIEESEIKLKDKTLKFTISLGVTTILDSDKSLFDAIKRADEKLYKAKRNGKNRVEL